MRIALFTDTFPPQINGVANHVATLAEQLVKRGHAVCVVTVSADKAWGGVMQSSSGFEIIAVPSFWMPGTADLRTAMLSPMLLSELRLFLPDIIHVHAPMALGWAGVWCARRLKIPIVGTHHTFFDVYFKEAGLPQVQGLSWKYVHTFYNKCAQVIAPSVAMKDAFDTHHSRAPVVHIENGIDLTRFTPSESADTKEALRQRWGATGKTIVYLGRLSVEKRVHVVVEACAQIPDAHLVVAGDGPERAALEELVQTLGISDRVLFTGFVSGSDVVDVLRAGDIFVSASQFENMPLSVLEAMACGLPVVAVRSLGMIDIVEDGVSGLLIDDASAEGMATALKKLMRDEALCARMARAAYKRSAQYSQERMAERIEQLYARVIAEKVPTK